MLLLAVGIVPAVREYVKTRAIQPSDEQSESPCMYVYDWEELVSLAKFALTSRAQYPALTNGEA